MTGIILMLLVWCIIMTAAIWGVLLILRFNHLLHDGVRTGLVVGLAVGATIGVFGAFLLRNGSSFGLFLQPFFLVLSFGGPGTVIEVDVQSCLLGVGVNSLIGACIGSTLGLYLRLSKGNQTAVHCQKCGYDLTGNVSGVCPECGTQVEQMP